MEDPRSFLVTLGDKKIVVIACCATEAFNICNSHFNKSSLGVFSVGPIVCDAVIVSGNVANTSSSYNYGYLVWDEVISPTGIKATERQVR